MEIVLVGIFIGAIVLFVISLIISNEDKKGMTQQLEFLTGNSGAENTINIINQNTDIFENNSKLILERCSIISQNLEELTQESNQVFNEFSEKEITIEQYQELSTDIELRRDKLFSEHESLMAEHHMLVKKFTSENLPEYSSESSDYGSSDVSTQNVPSIPKFQTTDKYQGSDGKTGIAVDKTNRLFALLTPYSNEVIQYTQIISGEVILDSEVIIKTDRVGQIGGALVGGALTGGVGALVMAMGAKKNQVDKINKVELKILTSGTNSPSHTIVFYEKGSGGWIDGAIKDATKWQDLISVSIKESQSVQATFVKSKFPSTSTISQSSLADELDKLATLKLKGMLTDLEFEKAKAKLI